VEDWVIAEMVAGAQHFVHEVLIHLKRSRTYTKSA